MMMCTHQIAIGVSQKLVLLATGLGLTVARLLVGFYFLAGVN